MKKGLTALLLLVSAFAQAADVKISQLPLATAASSSSNDSFPFVSASVNITKRMTLWDLINLPPMSSTYAPLANPVFTGTVTAPTFIGALTGNASTATALAANPTDCSTNQFANAIAANGNLTCAQVTVSNLAVLSASKMLETNGSGVITASSFGPATNANTASAGVARDGSGNFSAGTITAALTGTASGNTTITPSNHGVVISGSANAMTALAPDSSTTKTLISGGSSADPAWGTLAIGGGGTGQTTKAAAFDALSPMTTLGDIIYGGASGTGTRLANGTTGQVLTANTGAAPTWNTLTVTGPRNNIWVNGANGYGSSSTTVRRYTTIQSQVGSGITYADSSTLGTTFTIVTAGLYTINVKDGRSAGTENFAITLNGSALTTSAGNITYAQGSRAFVAQVSTAVPIQMTVTLQLAANDVIRVQGDGNSGMLTSVDSVFVNIVQVSN